MSDNLVKRLRQSWDADRSIISQTDRWMAERREAADRIEELEAENKKLRKGLDIYQRERDRYKHATPEMTGAYFLSGGHGPRDDNQMPQFVEVVPAYGCGWSMIYEYTGRTIMYEGS